MHTELILPRRELQPACSRLKKMAAKARFKSELVLDFEAISLTLTFAGVGAAIPVACPVKGRVIMPGLTLEALMKATSRGADQVKVQIDQERLHLGTLRLHCQWVAEQSEATLLPMNTEFRGVLCLRYRYSQAELEAAGLAKTLSDAEEKKSMLIAKAMEILEPLGVSQAALSHLVDDAIMEEANRHA